MEDRVFSQHGGSNAGSREVMLALRSLL